MTLKKVIALTATLTLTLGMCAVPVLAEDAETEFNEIIGADTEAEADAGEDMLADVAYIDDGDEDHTLDIFGAQAATDPMPVIVEVHGGGYVGGHKGINTEHAQFYAENGYVVVAPNYTHVPEGTFKTVVQELFTVFHWMENNAEEYHFDLDHVGISGDSAGGYYVLLTAAVMTQPELQEYFEVTPPEFEFSAVVTTCPGTDILAMRDNLGKDGPDGFVAGKIGEDILNDEDLMSHCDLYSIINPETYPAVYMVTTPGDDTTGAETLKFDQFLTDNGVDHTLVSYEDEGSGLVHVFNITKMEYPESQKANADIIAYFDSLLK